MRYAIWISILLTALATIVLLGGCASDPGAGYWIPRTVELPDGRTVTCVLYDGPSGTDPISCDWESIDDFTPVVMEGQ